MELCNIHTIRKCYKQTSLECYGVITIFMLLSGFECFMLRKEQIIQMKMTEIFLPQGGHRVTQRKYNKHRIRTWNDRYKYIIKCHQSKSLEYL
jgi:hypothetical protein